MRGGGGCDLVRTVQQVNAALGDIFANSLVAKTAQDVPEGGPARWQAAGRCRLPKLQVKHHHLHHNAWLGKMTAAFHALCTTLLLL